MKAALAHDVAEFEEIVPVLDAHLQPLRATGGPRGFGPGSVGQTHATTKVAFHLLSGSDGGY
jgi:hypothetical protein